MKNYSKSIIDKINKEYSFKYKFLQKTRLSIWNIILTISLWMFFTFVYPGINNIAKLFIRICELLNVTITESNLSTRVDIFLYFWLIIMAVITYIIIELLYNLLLKIIMKIKKIKE